ncbi:MAG: hypothetical protein MUC62_03685 [Candidatus Thermoplasmatota archaeon]|jgi:hypothetical protein|nr:hypothetical protein [Candidatus Thermoplasmatota archaeon]
MRAYEIAKEAFGLWKRDLGKYILPSAEYYLATMVVSSVLVFGILGIIGVLIVLSILGLIGGFLLSDGPFGFGFLSIILFPFLVLLVFIVLFPVLIVVMSFVNGVLNGGLSKAVLDIMSGRKNQFGDLIKTGWKDRWSFMKMELLKIVIILVVTLVPITIVSVIAIPLLIFPVIGFLFYYILIWLVSLALGVVVMPFHYLPYILYWKEGRYGWDAVSTSIKFMSEHWREALGLGLLYQVAAMVLMMVPGLGMVLALLAPAFLFTCLSLLYDEKRGRAMGMGPTFKRKVRGHNLR